MPVTADTWDARYAAGRRYRPVSPEEEDLFQRTVGPGAGRHALDIGCGTGGFAGFLHTLGYAVTGTDFAPTAVSLARGEHREPGISFVCMDAEGEWHELNSHRFNVISCRLSYAFIQDKKNFLDLVREHLHPEGVFHVMTPHADRVPETRKGTGLTASELTELREGWSQIVEHDLDSEHKWLALTV
ncbi:class I SAM-dependent methyltransferase [Streptomyces spirodelae]|uniref:Class I SAM-dependent methyltransferase n=1 Tax=Streptomyces spirodelae TaxID=2812904 RepID=A0ABS3X1C1_9ACTN|nr:class I SAM-dependent methyltransferase [Streptomyces spirodelae]MBO8189180.1 class I SAM-dependent methyltransferase [Streptomyces spirodelae]